MAPNYTSSHYVLHHHELADKEKLNNDGFTWYRSQRSCKNFQSYWYWPLSKYLLKILCHEIGSIHKTLLMHTKIWWLPWHQTRLWLTCKLNYTLFAPLKYHLYLIEQLIDKQTWVFSRHFLKYKQGKPLILRKTTDSILSMIKCKISSKLLNICICHHELDHFLIFKILT